MGYFQSCPDVYAELGELVTGKKKGRENSGERTFAVNLGVALEDMRGSESERAVKKIEWLPL
jgi:hypothetical protein